MSRVILKVFAPCEYLVNLCLIKKIPLKKVERSEKFTVLTVQKGYLDDLTGILTEKGKRYEVVADSSFSEVFKKNCGRIGLYIGVIFFIISAIFYSTKITRLEINGMENSNEEKIVEEIKNHLDLPIEKSSFDKKSLEKEIIKIDGISSVSCELRGNTIIVNIAEELPKVETEDPSDFSDITSNYDAVITRIIAYSGEAKVKQGDVVKQGDILISAEKTVDEELGLTVKEHPYGEIYGRVWITKSVFIPEKVIRTRRTGRVEKRISFFRPQQRYYGEFSQYERECEISYLYGIFPIKIYTEIYYETENYEENFDAEKNAEGIVKGQVEEIEAELPESTIGGNFWFYIKIVDKTTIFDIYYEAEVKLNR